MTLDRYLDPRDSLDRPLHEHESLAMTQHLPWRGPQELYLALQGPLLHCPGMAQETMHFPAFRDPMTRRTNNFCLLRMDLGDWDQDQVYLENWEPPSVVVNFDVEALLVDRH